MARGTTYVEITRAEVEPWLDTMPRFRGNWWVKQGTKGIYVLPLSENVAIELSTTLGESTSKGYARAAVGMKLVSLLTGHILNKKAQGRTHFKRTKGWRKTWKEGLDNFVAAYTKSTAFYERIALPEDQQEQDSAQGAYYTDSELRDVLEDLRFLFLAVREAGDQKGADFVASVGKQLKENRGKKPTEKQRNWLDNLSDRHWQRAEEIKAERGGVARRAALAERWAKRKLTPESFKRWQKEHPDARESDFEIVEPKGNEKGEQPKGESDKGKVVRPYMPSMSTGWKTLPADATPEQKTVFDVDRKFEKIDVTKGIDDPTGPRGKQRVKERRQLRKNVQNALDAKDPDPAAVAKALKALKKDMFPLGGKLNKLFRGQARKLDDMITQLEGKGKKASMDLTAVYRAVEDLLAELDLVDSWGVID